MSELPIVSGLATSTFFWAAQTEPATSNSMFDQLTNYGFAGLVVALVVWGLQFFEKRSERERKMSDEEVDSYRKELAEERADRKKVEQEYLANIKKLNDEITQLRVDYVKIEAELKLLKNQQSN